MAQVSMQQVKELRDRTQAGLNDCRGALLESDGDMEKAVEIILKKGLAKSAKRAGAVASEGLVAALVAPDGTSGVMAEVNIQTDFAARNADFIAFVENVVKAAETADPGSDLGKATYPAGGGSVEEVRAALVGKLGENITVRRWQRLSASKAGKVVSYVHMGGKVGVLLAAEVGDGAALAKPEFNEFLENTAMQIAAMGPLYLTKSEVPEDEKQKQGEIFLAQLAEEGKTPEDKRPQIVQGKIAKWMKEVCLLEQESVLEGNKSVDTVRAEASKTIGGEIALKSFVRFERGEGIEKPPAEDFAAEVAKTLG